MDPDETDLAVVRQLAAGRDAFLAYLRRRLDDPELAEDLLQDSLLRAVRAAPELRDDQRLLPWFYRVLHNATVDAYRRRGVRGGEMPMSTLGLDTAGQVAAPPAESDPVACACFRTLLPSLKPEYAELIESLDLGSETPEQAAARLGITSNNLKVRHHRARQALRRRLEQTCRTCAEHHCLDCTCRTDA
jgi:RNA polymerase sigma-70 factor (ECF subfamily)